MNIWTGVVHGIDALEILDSQFKHDVTLESLPRILCTLTVWERFLKVKTKQKCEYKIILFL